MKNGTQQHPQHLLSATVAAVTIGLLATLSAGCASTQHSSHATQNASASASASAATAADSPYHRVTRCTRTHGVLRIITDQHSNWYQALKADGLEPPQPVLEEIVRQSGCYTIASADTPQTHSLVPTIRLDREAPSPFTIGFGSWGRNVGIGVQTRLRSTRASATLAVVPVAATAGDDSTGTTLTATGEASRTNLGTFARTSAHSGAADTSTTAADRYLQTRAGRLTVAAFINAYNQLVKKHYQTQTKMKDAADNR